MYKIHLFSHLIAFLPFESLNRDPSIYGFLGITIRVKGKRQGRVAWGDGRVPPHPRPPPLLSHPYPGPVPLPGSPQALGEATVVAAAACLGFLALTPPSPPVCWHQACPRVTLFPLRQVLLTSLRLPLAPKKSTTSCSGLGVGCPRM